VLSIGSIIAPAFYALQILQDFQNTPGVGTQQGHNTLLATEPTPIELLL
jgi:hypothetical protein